jgi:hypothetical protein
MAIPMKSKNILSRAAIRATPCRTFAVAAALLGCVTLEAISSPDQYKVYTDSKREPRGSITTWSATNSGDTIIFQLHNKASGSNWVLNLQLSEGHVSSSNTIDEREPKGSHNLFFDSRDNPNIGFYLHNSVSGSNWIKSSRVATITLPYILRDVDSGVTFEVEADGRHVSATDRYGALLLYRDPFADAHLEHYRTDTPCIVSFDFHKRSASENWDFPEQVLRKKGIDKFIRISFNSSQTGFLNIMNGEFFFTGQL